MPYFFAADKQTIFSGTVKVNNNFKLPKKVNMQITAVYLAPDIIPQAVQYHVD